MKIICKKQGETKLISIDSEYEVIDQSETRYTILNDKGIQKNYSKKLFEVAEEVPAMAVRAPRAPRQPRQVPPVVIEPVVVIPTVNELVITTSADYVNGLINFRVKTQFMNNAIFEFDIRSLSIYGSNISCGIKDVEGFNGFMQRFSEFLPELKAYIVLNQHNFILNEDINLEEINSEVCDSLFQDFIALFEGGDYNAGLVNLSTNVTNNEYLSDIVINAIEKIAQNTVETRNPNSGNQIKFWSIVVG